MLRLRPLHCLLLVVKFLTVAYCLLVPACCCFPAACLFALDALLLDPDGSCLKDPTCCLRLVLANYLMLICSSGLLILCIIILIVINCPPLYHHGTRTPQNRYPVTHGVVQYL